MARKRFAWLTAPALCLALVGCVDRQKEALQRLRAGQYRYVVSDFIRAAEGDDAPALRNFLAAGMGVDSPDAHGRTAFAAAVTAGQDNAQQILLHAGANPNQRLPSGGNALLTLMARVDGAPQTFHALLDAGADFKAADARGMTPAMIAASKGQDEALRRLLSLEIDSLDRAFLFAAAEGRTSCLDILANEGAHANAHTAEGQTAMHLAAHKGHAETVGLLLRLGADPLAVDHAGRTAAEVATLAKHSAIPPLIARHDFASPAPATSLHGQVLPVTAQALVERLSLGVYRERCWPIVLDAVTGKAAKFRLAQPGLGLVETEAAEGSLVPQTSLLLREVHAANDPAEVFVLVDDGRGHLARLRLGEFARNPEFTWLELRLEAQVWACREGDEFALEGSPESWRVGSIRPHQLLLQGPAKEKQLISRKPRAQSRL